MMLQNMDNFSKCYMDGKIFPSRTTIIEDREAIKKRWTLPANVKIVKHKIIPSETTLLGHTAYNYGYYEGETITAMGDTSSWRGKYVIVWKKQNNDWKMYLDIWNRVE